MLAYRRLGRGISIKRDAFDFMVLDRRCFTPSHPTSRDGIPTFLSSSAEELEQRRQLLFSCMEPNSIFILPAAGTMYATNDIISSSFRQDTLFYHLFGLHTPMVKELAPSPHHLHIHDQLALTMAVFVKGPAPESSQEHPGGHKCFLFVDGKTTEKESLVWDYESTHAEVVEGLLCGGDDCHGQPNRPSSLYTKQHDIFTIVEAILAEVKGMAARKIQEVQRAFVSHAPGGATVLSPAQLKRLNPLPAVTFHYPSQMCWSGHRFRLPPYKPHSSFSRDSPLSEGKAKEIASIGSPSVLFHHPLEALLVLLCSSMCEVQLTQPLVVASSGHPKGSATQLKALRFLYEPAKVPSVGNVWNQLPNARGELAKTYKNLLSFTFAVQNAPDTVEGVEKDKKTAQGTGASTTTEMAVITTPMLPAAQAFLWQYRAVKAPAQLTSFLLSAECTRFIFEHVMRNANTPQHANANIRSWASEFSIHCDIQALLATLQLRAGPTHLLQSAYIPVIASGRRAFHIHYTANHHSDKEEERVGTQLVRLDFGVELNNVPIDCTRTFPLNNKHFFAQQEDLNSIDALQRKLYHGLLQLQRTLLQTIREGVTVQSVAAQHVALTQELLYDMGVYEQEDGEKRKQKPSLASVKSVFCAHSFGHFFGLDIHERVPVKLQAPSHSPSDTSVKEKSTFGRVAPTTFLAGMMHTVEPGVYIPPADLLPLVFDGQGGTPTASAVHLPAPLEQGLGMQVEDDVLVLPPPSVEVDESDPPRLHTRVDYLAAALRAFEEALRWRHAVLQGTEEHRCSAADDGDGIPHALRTPYRFLFEQRCCIEGVEVALAKRDDDVRTLTACFPSTAADGKTDSVLCVEGDAWYPYHIICLTAGIPKDESSIHSILCHEE